MQIDDIYGASNLVRQWDIVDGRPQCIADGIPCNHLNAVTALQRNAAVRTLIEEVETYETALQVNEPSEKEPLIISMGDESIRNPIWVAYEAAQEEIETASDHTRKLALWRTPEPEDSTSLEWEEWDSARDDVIEELDRLSLESLITDPRPVPTTIPLWAARAALKQFGMFDAADNAIKDSGDVALQQLWEFGNVITRQSHTVTAMGAALGLTDDQIDALFRAADVLDL